MSRLPNNSKPTSIRLGEIKAPLQRAAMEKDRSLNWYIIHLLNQTEDVKKYFEEKKRRYTKL